MVRWQDLAASIFLAYTSKQWVQGSQWFTYNLQGEQAASGSQTMSNSSYASGLSSTMGGFSLAIAGCVCLGLAAHRLRWGDDNGNYLIEKGPLSSTFVSPRVRDRSCVTTQGVV